MLNPENLKKTKAYLSFIENLKPKTYNFKLLLRFNATAIDHPAI